MLSITEKKNLLTDTFSVEIKPSKGIYKVYASLILHYYLIYNSYSVFMILNIFMPWALPRVEE